MKMTVNKHFIKVRGKDMHVEIHGADDAYPLLYLHGGPGQGCYEFCFHQAKRLQREFKLIAIDQRGVCRSEEIKEDEPFSIDDLIYDCEALREILKIEKWAIIGHSFGGYLALKYVTMFPESVTKVIFECPTFDLNLSGRSLLKKTAEIAKEEKMDELAETCLTLAESNLSAKELMLKFVQLRTELDDKGTKIHIHNFKHKTDYSFYTNEQWEEFFKRSNIHNSRLMDGEEMFESVLPLLGNFKHPSLLIQGKYDPVTCEKHVMEFQKTVQHGHIITLEHSGHFPHKEEPDKFMKALVQFLK